MAFKDGGTVKKLTPGQGTVSGAPAPKNPGAPSVGLGGFQVEIAPGAGTSTTNSGPMQAANGAAGNDLVDGSALAMPESATSGASGGTAGFASASGGGSPAYQRTQPLRGSQRAQQGNSGGKAPLIRPEPTPAGNVPKGGAIIPKGAPNFKGQSASSTMRPKRK